MADQASFGEFEFLRRLTEAAGVPGREERIRDMILEETTGLWDETQVDALGNLICLKRATRSAAPRSARPAKAAEDRRPPRVMLACHMDEIGFYVRYIDEDGRLRVQNVGGFDPRNLFARKVLVQGRRDLLGVMNPTGKPVHLATDEEKKKVPTIQELFVDLFLPRKEVEKLVAVGDPVTLVQQTDMIGSAICGKSLDNRIALWVGINAVRRAFAADSAAAKAGKRGSARRPAARGGSRYDVYFVACVQEEVGVRGATTAAYAINPDIGLAIDTTLCCDTPGINKDEVVTQFGGGVALKVLDSLSISHRGLLDEFQALARSRRIRHQLEVLPRGGTDASAVQRTRAGTRALTISVPTRYIHTVTEAVHKDDALAAVDLIAAWLTA